MMFTLDSHGAFLDFIPASGIEPFKPATEFLGKNVRQILPKEVADLSLQHIQQCLETREVQSSCSITERGEILVERASGEFSNIAGYDIKDIQLINKNTAAYLTKPFHMDDQLDTMRVVLN